MYNFSKIFISLLGLGFFPYASGTIGSFFSLIIFYFIFEYINTIHIIFIFLSTLIISIKLIDIYTITSGKNDASEIIVDEFLGIAFILIFYDNYKFTNNITMFVFIFFLFRFFDIFKFFPANWIDKNIKNSWGVILDDLVASIYCLFILFVLHAIL